MKTPQRSRISLAAIALASLTLALGASAQEAMKMDHADHAMHSMAPASDAAASAPAADASAAPGSTEAMTDGEILRVNLSAGKASIRHGAITNLNMPAMSMVFAFKNPEDLKKLKEGDKVRFHVERENGALVVTKIDVTTE